MLLRKAALRSGPMKNDDYHSHRQGTQHGMRQVTSLMRYNIGLSKKMVNLEQIKYS
jgi:hypothetical protein